jgi:hypothetical protein
MSDTGDKTKKRRPGGSWPQIYNQCRDNRGTRFCDRGRPCSECLKHNDPCVYKPGYDHGEPAAKKQKIDAVTTGKTRIVRLLVSPPTSTSSSDAMDTTRIPQAMTGVGPDATDVHEHDATDTGHPRNKALAFDARRATGKAIIRALQSWEEGSSSYGDLFRMVCEMSGSLNGAIFKLAVDSLERAGHIQVTGAGMTRHIALMCAENIDVVSYGSLPEDEDISESSLAWRKLNNAMPDTDDSVISSHKHPVHANTELVLDNLAMAFDEYQYAGVTGTDLMQDIAQLERDGQVQVTGEDTNNLVLLNPSSTAAIPSASVATDEDDDWNQPAQNYQYQQDDADDELLEIESDTYADILTGPDATAAQISAAEEAKKAEGDRNLASRIAQSQKLVDRIYAGAVDDWKPDELAKVLQTVLETHFHSKNGELDQSITVYNNGFDTVIRRDDILSLYTSEWLQDGVISAILTILYPLGHTPGRVQILDTVDFNSLAMMAGQAMDLDECGLRPFQFRDSIDEIVGVMNERGVHWFTFRIVKSTHTIEIYDSWAMEIAAEQAQRVAVNGAILLTLVQHFSTGDDVDESWICDDFPWKLEWRSETFMQENSDDCGVHTLRNVQNLVDVLKVLPYHRAASLRHRFARLLSETLQGRWEWGD